MRLFGKIGRKLLGWFLLVALIPLLFMGYQGYFFAKKAVQREVFLHMQAVAAQKQGQIEQWFHERLTDMRVLSANPQVIEAAACCCACQNNVLPLLESFRIQSQSYSHLCLRDTTGNVIACTAGMDNTQDQPEGTCYELHARAARAFAPVMGSIYLSERFGPSMQLANAVRDENGTVIGTIMANLTLTRTLNPIMLDTTGLGLSGQAYLVDNDKVMLTPSRFMNHPAPLTHKMDTEGIRRALGKSEIRNPKSGNLAVNAAVYTGFEGQQVMGAWAYLTEQKWALIAEMDAEEAFAPLAALRRNTILVALLMLGVIAIVVVFISRSLSDPIRKLAEASLDVSQGNLDRTVVVKLNDELGELAGRFNVMVHSLKESQRLLVQSEKLAAIGELAASVVHEIRNPLSAIKMNLRILENKIDSPDSSIAVHFQIAKQQTERLEIMLTELLDYAKPLSLQKKTITVNALINDTLKAFQSEQEKTDVKIELTMENPAQTLQVDAGKMQQVLWNLLLNAVQSSDSGQKIIVACKIFSVANKKVLELSVKDNGKGIAEENLKRIFEPFFTTRKQGTGLGLPNAKKIIEAHNGTIAVQSQLDKGTTIIISIPI